MQNLALVDTAFLRLAVDPRLVGAAAACLGTPDINLHHMKASLKPPQHQSEQGWHQDAYYLQEQSADGGMPFVTILVYLDATAAGAGATMVIEKHPPPAAASTPTPPPAPTFSSSSPSSASSAPHVETMLVPAGELADPTFTNPALNGSIRDDAAKRRGTVVQPLMAVGDALAVSPFIVHSVAGNTTRQTKVAL